MESGGAFAWNQLLDCKFTSCKFVFSKLYQHYLCPDLKTAVCASQLIATCWVFSVIWAGLAEVGSPWWLRLSTNLTCLVILLPFCLSSCFSVEGTNQLQNSTFYPWNRGTTLPGQQQPPDVSSLEAWAPQLRQETAWWFWQERRGNTSSQAWAKPLT